jgi:hypothetical protein
MTGAPKILFVDDQALRSEIDALAERADQVTLAKWAVQCAKHVEFLIEEEFPDHPALDKGFFVLELWLKGLAQVHDVRQAGFEVHDFARRCTSEIAVTAARAAGHAISVGHMREHAMVCSDYSVKAIGLSSSDNTSVIRRERTFQRDMLRKLIF